MGGLRFCDSLAMKIIKIEWTNGSNLLFRKKYSKSLESRKKTLPLQPHLEKCSLIRDNAAIAQLVERDLAKVEVAGSSPVCRSFLE